jgi:hypothetical protein
MELHKSYNVAERRGNETHIRMPLLKVTLMHLAQRAVEKGQIHWLLAGTFLQAAAPKGAYLHLPLTGAPLLGPQSSQGCPQ